jgi:hypothetical protein
MSVQHRLFKRNGKKINDSWHLSATQDMCANGLLFGSDFQYLADDTVELRVVMCGALNIFNGRGRVVRVDKKISGAFYLVAVCLESSARPKRDSRRKLPIA